MTFFIPGAYYQMFKGVKSDDIDIIVNFIDNSTNETIESSSYKEWISSPDDKDGAEDEAGAVDEELLTGNDIPVIRTGETITSDYLHYLFELPEEVAKTSEAINISSSIGGNDYSYRVR